MLFCRSANVNLLQNMSQNWVNPNNCHNFTVYFFNMTNDKRAMWERFLTGETI